MANFSLNLSQLGGRFAKDLLTLSLEASSVRLMVSSGRNISGGLNMPFNPRLVTDGRVEDPAGLSQIIKNGVSRLGFKGGAVVAAFPSLRVNARILNLPSVRGIKPEMAIPREARRIIGSALDFQELFWAPINVVGGGQSYYLVAAPKTELIAFHQTLALSGIRAKTVDTRALALTRAVGAASAHILNIETNGLDLVVVSDYVPQSATHMQLSLGMPMEELVGEIVEEFQTTTGQGGDANSPASFSGNTPVYVCGGHPQLNSGLTEALGDILGRQLFLPDPPMDYPEDFLVDQFMVNVGLALKRT